MSKVGTATTVNIGTPDEGGVSSPVLVMERASKEGTATEKYFRVHSNSAYTLKPSTGSVNKAGDGTKNCIEYVTFNNSQIEGLRYPNPLGVGLDVIGNFITQDGGTASVSYDAVRKAVVASKPCYGIVKVTYTSKYDMWRATFSSGLLSPN